MFTRVTQAAEIACIARLAREIWTGHYTPIIGREQVDYMLEHFQSESAIQQQIHQGMHYVLISERAGYFAYDIKPDHLFLSKLYIHPDYRRQGLARQAVGWLRQTGHPHPIRLTVNRYNADTLTAYRHLGFERIGEQVTDIGNGFVMDDYVMQLPADAASGSL